MHAEIMHAEIALLIPNSIDAVGTLAAFHLRGSLLLNAVVLLAVLASFVGLAIEKWIGR